MRAARVEQARRSLAHRVGLDLVACRVVVQAEHDQIDRGHQLPLGPGIAAHLGGDRRSSAVQPIQPLADAKPGGTGLAIDLVFDVMKLAPRSSVHSAETVRAPKPRLASAPLRAARL